MYRSIKTRSSRGFSLLEVLIAVVVLATGLLALATLQANLSRSSAEAKVRGRVAAMLSARMDQLRTAGFDSAVTGTFTTNTAENCATSASPWLCNAGKEAGLAQLTVNQTVQIWSGALGGNTFTAAAPTDPANDPQFKRVSLAANWADSGGVNHALSMMSDLSALALRSSLVPPPDSTSSSNVNPVVREDDPTETGMIPIAIGDGSQTAATNPKPVVVGKNNTLIETKFNVLTYFADAGATQVQQRVETTVIGCKCQYGNRPTGIFNQSFRPTYWDGTHYKSPNLIGATDAAQRPSAGPVGSGSTDKSNPQSDLCTDCCRDHHDQSTDTIKFDPFRTDAHDHYRNNNLSAAVQSNSGQDYNESCRVIRVDGFWRVATDARVVHFDYIGTGPATSDQGPDPTMADYYRTFVVDYLRNRFVGPDDGLSADARYAAAPLKHPASITILANEKRYQHTHGMLVDNIEPEAQRKIDAQVAGCTKTNKADCVLPYIPFTTINLTELSHYVASNDKVIAVLDGGANFNDSTVIQGQVMGLSTAPTGTNTVTSDATIKISNSGLAGILPIDPQDATTLPTPPPVSATWVPGKQTYSLTNGTPTTGDDFFVSLSPAFATMNNGTFLDDPGIRWGTGLTPCGANSTTATNPYKCHNTSGFGGASTAVTVSGYNGYLAGVGTDVPVGQRTVTCKEDKNNSTDTLAYTLTSTDPIRICKNYSVVANAAYTIGAVTPSDGAQAEQTQVTFPSVTGGSNGTIYFGQQADTYSFTCTYKQTGNATTFTVVAAACP